MGFLISLFLLISPGFAQQAASRETAPPAATIRRPAPRPPPFRQRLYVPVFWGYFEEQFNALSSTGDTMNKSVFQGMGVGLEFERVRGRWGTGIGVQYLQGQVDLEATAEANFPRHNWNGVLGNLRGIYRFKRRVDAAFTVFVLRKDIERFGSSYSPGYSLDLRMAMSDRVEFYQSVGTFGLGNSLALNVGLRFWAL
ncbi:MAG: hypothetical protein KF802_08860 [Bdellovibrionaceae bacterium]|nr:hypothetical protein [Pseudobdellovibrionaceae bacterium]MBX3034159.1 hypothetical protein [Pseudobdellovibrionaceae bacterium]